MEVVICKTKEEASRLAAGMITDAVKKNPKTVLGLATVLEWRRETLISLDFCRGPEGTSQGASER